MANDLSEFVTAQVQANEATREWLNSLQDQIRTIQIEGMIVTTILQELLEAHPNREAVAESVQRVIDYISHTKLEPTDGNALRQRLSEYLTF